MEHKKAIVMLSGGLDSRLVVKIMQEQGYDVLAFYFKLPFSKDNEEAIRDYCKKHNARLKIFDYTKGKLLKEYLELIKNPIHGRGAGINPCLDCRIFMLNKAREHADKLKVDVIATGEVLGQRPMSQHKQGLGLVERKSMLKERLVRPLIEKGIRGRRREEQIKMAEKFKIDYPTPAGGCLLCEKNLRNRFNFLIKRGLNSEEIKLSNLGRHFVIDNCWVVLGKDDKENKIIEGLEIGEKIISKIPGPTAIILDSCEKPTKDKIKKLIIAYSRGGDRQEFEKYLI